MRVAVLALTLKLTSYIGVIGVPNGFLSVDATLFDPFAINRFTRVSYTFNAVASAVPESSAATLISFGILGPVARRQA